jgi:hypothetical protein
MNCKDIRIRKGKAVANLRIYPGVCQGFWGKLRNVSVRIAGNLAEIRRIEIWRFTTTLTCCILSGNCISCRSRWAQWYRAGLRGGWSVVRVPAGAGNFPLHHHVQTGSGAHPVSYPMGTRGSFPVGERPRREADHAPPSSVEVKNAWSYTSTPPIRVLMKWCLAIKSTGTTLPVPLLYQLWIPL